MVRNLGATLGPDGSKPGPPGSRLMTPVFQSNLVPLGWARDAFLGPIGRIPWARRQFVTTLMGIRTSPWTMWRPDGHPVPKMDTD